MQPYRLHGLGSTTNKVLTRDTMLSSGIRCGNEVLATAVKVASDVDIREARALDIGSRLALAALLLGPCSQLLSAGRIACFHLLQSRGRWPLSSYSVRQLASTLDVRRLYAAISGAGTGAAGCAGLALLFGCFTSRRASFRPGCDRPSRLLLCWLLHCSWFSWAETLVQPHTLLLTWDPGGI